MKACEELREQLAKTQHEVILLKDTRENLEYIIEDNKNVIAMHEKRIRDLCRKVNTMKVIIEYNECHISRIYKEKFQPTDAFKPEEQQ